MNAARLRACAIVPSQNLIPHRTRQTLVAWSCLCISDIASADIFQSQPQTKKRVTNAVTVYLGMDTVPFQNVDRKGFKEMLKTLDPRYALPARTHFHLPNWDAKVIWHGLRANADRNPCYQYLCISEMEVTFSMEFYGVSNQYFSPSEAIISKLEDTINIPQYNTVTVLPQIIPWYTF